MKHYLFIVVCLFVANDLLAQSDTIFYDENLNGTPFRDSASFYSIKEIDIEKNLFIKRRFYISGKIEMVAFYTNQGFLKKTDKFVTYYENGIIKEEGEYKENNKDGKWTERYENGHLKFEVTYKDNIKVGEQVYWYSNGQKQKVINVEDEIINYLNAWNIEGSSQLENGNGLYKEFYESGKLAKQGKVENGKAEGEWQIFTEVGELSNIENFEKGVFIKGISYKDGKEYPYTHKFLMPCMDACNNLNFPDDRIYCTNQEIMKFIATNLNYPEMAKDNDIEGKVYVSFIVEENGDVTDVQILKGVDVILDREALKVVKNLPQFIPGKMDGIITKVKYTIPIVFKLG